MAAAGRPHAGKGTRRDVRRQTLPPTQGPRDTSSPPPPPPEWGRPATAGARALPAAAVPAQGGARCTSSRLCPGRTPPPGAPRGRDGHHGLRRASARPACCPTAPTGRLLPFAGCQVMPPPARDRKGHCHAAPVLPTPALGCSGHTARAGVRLRPRCPPPTQPGAPAPTRDSGRNVGGARASLPHGTLALAGRTRPPAPSRPAPPNCCWRGGDPAAGCRPESRRGGASMGPHARTRTLLLTGTAPTSPTRALHAQRPSLLPLPPAVCARGLGPPPPPPAPGRGQQRGHLSTEDMSPAVPSASTRSIQPIGAVQRTELGSRLTAAEQRVPRELGAAGVQTSVSARPRSQRQCPRCPHFPEMPREQSLLANPRRLT